MTLLLIQGLKLQEQSLCEIWYSCSIKKGQEHWWKCAMTLRASVGRGLVLFTFCLHSFGQSPKSMGQRYMVLNTGDIARYRAADRNVILLQGKGWE